MGRLMYTSHVASSGLQNFLPNTLIKAVENTVEIEYIELLEMRRIVEEIAGDIEKIRPDLIPFFARGGIPFMIPAMEVLAKRRVVDLVDGSRFHMFPGLSWSEKAEPFFAREFGGLIENVASSQDQVHIWTMDATFTGNAIRKLIKSIYLAFHNLENRPSNAVVTLVAVIDASRADKEPSEGKIPLHSSYGTRYLLAPADFSPVSESCEPISELHDRIITRFCRNECDELFELNVELRVVKRIITEDRAELIGGKVNKEILGISPEQIVGRLTLKFENGYSPSGTGGSSLDNNIINYLSVTEDCLPWYKWQEIAELETISETDQENYEKMMDLSRGGLAIFEAKNTPTKELCEAYLLKKRLLDSAEVHILKERAFAEFCEQKGIRPISFSTKLLLKAIASAMADGELTSDTLGLIRICNLDEVKNEPGNMSEPDLLEWWRVQLKEEPKN